MRKSQEVTAIVTGSVHFFKVQQEHFYPCPHSCQAQVTMKYIKFKYSRTSPVWGVDTTAKAFNISVSLVVLLVQLGRMRGSVRPHVSIKARLNMTSSLMLSTSGNSFQKRSIRHTPVCTQEKRARFQPD